MKRSFWLGTVVAGSVGLAGLSAQEGKFGKPSERPPATATQTETTAEKLVGTYKIMASQKGDQATPRDKIDGVVVTFTADKIVAVDKDKKEVYAAKYQLSSQQPATITMTSTMPGHEGTTAKGMIQMVSDNEVKLVYTLPQRPGAAAGKEQGPVQHTITMQRVTPGGSSSK